MLDLDKIVEQAIRNVHDRKLQAGDTEAGTWAHNARELWSATSKGVGIRTAYDGSTTDELAAALRQNLFVFAAFKNHHMVADMAALLTDEGGRLRPFEEFRHLALQVSKDYNVSWLRAEYDTALASGQMAVRWRDIERDKKALPYLRYVTAGDGRVRAAHAKLDGATKPVDDPFWDEWFPPNGYACRCDVQQVAGGERGPKNLPTDKEVPPTFRNNPGKSGQVFTTQHPYFQLVKPEQRQRLLRATGKLIFDNYGAEYFKDAASATAAGFRALRDRGGALGHDAASGGFVVLHKGHSPSGLADELPVLGILRKQGAMLELLDETGGDRYDLFWDGHFWDIKRLSQATKPIDRMHKIFNRAKHQGHFKILLHLDMSIGEDVLRKAVYNASRQNPQITLLEIVWNDGRRTRLSVQEMQGQDWK